MFLIICNPYESQVCVTSHTPFKMKSTPSGGLEPSQSDINITAQLKAVGEIVGIELLDHIIFNRTGYFSFLETGGYRAIMICESSGGSKTACTWRLYSTRINSCIRIQTLIKFHCIGIQITSLPSLTRNKRGAP